MNFNSARNRKSKSKQFYDQRFSEGYMQEWPDEKKNRVLKIIKSLDLPSSGRVLDFGCGNGVFTEVLIQALPGWKVFGADISSVAVVNAKKRVQTAEFRLIDQFLNDNIKFNLIFSHHVFEHVHNTNQIVDELMSLLDSEKASMFHILPCGNEGSYEYQICALRKGGVDKENGNRFFFEDEGHVRRMTTDSMLKIMRKHRFMIEREYYANQYFGAMRWIAHSDFKFILNLTKSDKANSLQAKFKIIGMRIMLLILSLMTRRIKSFFLRQNKNQKSPKDYFIQFLSVPFFVFWPAYFWLEKQSDKEWEEDNSDRRGSEMYLFFKKVSKHSTSD